MSLLGPVFAAGELFRVRAELDRLDRKVAAADREGDEDRALRFRRERFCRTVLPWARQGLRILTAFDAALRDAAQRLDAELLDELASELRPPGIGQPGSRAAA